MAKTIKNETETLNPKLLDEKIKAKNIGGLYCLFGDEEFMVDYYIKRIRESTDGECDCAVFDADNFDLNLLKDMIMSYNMGGGYKIAVIKNAGDIKFRSGEKDDLIDTLADYAGDIRDYACIIFKFRNLAETEKSEKEKLDKSDKSEKSEKSESTGRKTSGKKSGGKSLIAFLKENAELYEFKENNITSLIKWLKKICASEKIEISDENAEYILNRTDKKMYPLKNEIDKLINLAQSDKRSVITKEDIDTLIIQKIDMEAFEMTNAVLEKKYDRAAESLEKFRHFKEEPVAVLGQLSRHFCDLTPINTAMSSGMTDNVTISKKTGIHEYKVKLTMQALKRYKNPSEFINKALNLCRECDVKLKSTQLPDYDLLENLIFNISQL